MHDVLQAMTLPKKSARNAVPKPSFCATNAGAHGFGFLFFIIISRYLSTAWPQE